MFKLCKKNKKNKSQFFLEKTTKFLPKKKKKNQELVLFYFILNYLWLKWVSDELLTNPLIFVIPFFLGSFFWRECFGFRCLFLSLFWWERFVHNLSKFGDKTSLMRTRNEPSKLFFLPPKKERKKLKKGPIQLDDIGSNF